MDAKDSSKTDTNGKLPINGPFSNENLKEDFSSNPEKYKQKYYINPHPGFEIVSLPNGNLAKLAYGRLYDEDFPDHEIELRRIRLFEKKLKNKKKDIREKAYTQIKFHYKRAISLISPKMSKGWNRWSENTLDLLLENKLHKVLWGSGDCGKSATMALLIYIKWRVNPEGRMTVIATRVVADAKARVFAYIKEIHTKSPPTHLHKFMLIENNREKAIYCMMRDEKTKKYVKNDRACIITLPIKVNAQINELGANLMGKHPDDILTIAFDEAQELPGNIIDMKIFLNWYTNTNIEILAWGNPSPIDFYNPPTYDLLFRLGAGHLSLVALRNREKRAEKTDRWVTPDTSVLRFSMMDSPKDDPDEVDNFIEDESGQRLLRLHFLAGKSSVSRIAAKTSPNSPAWFSQVLGFPYLDTRGNRGNGALTPGIVQVSKEYPLQWRTPEDKLEWFMGVDSAITGFRDESSIICGRTGQMNDGRSGVDLVNGKYCMTVKHVEGEDFTDTTINAMWRLSQELKIPLRNIGLETHGMGEVLKYAMQKHFENEKNPKWKKDIEMGQMYYTVSPMISPTDRLLFVSPKNMRPSKDIVMNITTEYYLAVRCAFIYRQMFNVPEYVLQEFYTRFLLKNAAGTRYVIEKKEDMLKRGVRSPNNADALCYLLETIRNRSKFKYQVRDHAGYHNLYGEEYALRQQEKNVNSKMGIVSRILNTTLNFSQPPKKRRNFDLDSI